MTALTDVNYPGLQSALSPRPRPGTFPRKLTGNFGQKVTPQSSLSREKRKPLTVVLEGSTESVHAPRIEEDHFDTCVLALVPVPLT